MPKFRIADRQKLILTEVYEVEAATKEEAVRLYEEELAGSLEREDFWIDPYAEDLDGKIEALD